MAFHLNRWNTLNIGVLFSSDLTWSTHVDSICSRARKLVGLLFRRFSANVDSHTLLEIYELLVRPHLEYVAQVWNPHLIKNITKLEDIQKFALRKCYNNWDAGYQELLDLSTMPTLENRRLYLKLCTLYKKDHLRLFLFSTQCFYPTAK